MTDHKTGCSWTITWDRFKYLVRQDFTIEYTDHNDSSEIYELRYKEMLPGEIMELWIYIRGCNMPFGRMTINGAHNQILQMRGNMVAVVPEQPQGTHPGLELHFYQLAPVSAAVLKGRIYQRAPISAAVLKGRNYEKKEKK